MDGVVTSLVKEEGEVVIGAQSFQPTVIMTVADLSVMQAEMLVDETDIRNVALGQEAKVRVDALERDGDQGEVTEIGVVRHPARPDHDRRGQHIRTNTGNQAKDFKVTVTLRIRRPACARASTRRPTSPRRGRERRWPCPSRPWWCGEVDKDGRTIDPGRGAGVRGRSRRGRRAAKGEEKEGVFVVKDGQVRPSGP